MKNLNSYIICFLAASGLSLGAGAQELSSNTSPDDIKSVPADSTRNQRMESDLHKRDSLTNNIQVMWKDLGYGYNGTYTSDSVQYMARYDKEGKYVETLTKKEWKDNAPAKLRASYDQSPYKSQKVTGYWEVTDPSRKGYYLELNSDQNKTSRVWVNEDGKFSTSPEKSGMQNKDMHPVPDSTVKRAH